MNSNSIWKKIKNGVFIVAEAGKNFIQTQDERSVEEYLSNAKELVDRAVWAGADAIKFQTHNREDEQLNVKIVASHFKGMDRYSWVGRNDRATPVNEFWRPLKEYCDQKGIVFFSTPMSRGAARKLFEVGVPLWKIGSGDILDYVMLDYLRRTDLPIIMSSGASSLEEVERSLNFLCAKNKRVALMHALSKYPGEPEEANLAIMNLYREKFPGVPIGFSENSIGIEPSLVAAVLGATMLEKHFTLRRDLWGADHKVCSTPDEFKALVDQIRAMETDSSVRERWFNHPKFNAIFGAKEKILRADEAVFRPVFQKSLSAGQDIAAGTALTAEMVYALRPRSMHPGLESERYESVIGKRTRKALKKYDPITEESLIV